MNPQSLILILASVCLSAMAQVSFKIGVSAATAAERAGSGGPLLLHAILTPGVIAGLALYGIGTLLWLAALSQVELSQAYPFVGLGFVLTSLFGYLLFGEALGPQRVIGTLLVLGGIVVVARS